MVTVWKVGYGAGTRERWKWGGQLGSAAGVGDIDDAGLVWGFIRGDREKQNQLGVWISFTGLRNYQRGENKEFCLSHDRRKTAYWVCKWKYQVDGWAYEFGAEYRHGLESPA